MLIPPVEKITDYQDAKNILIMAVAAYSVKNNCSVDLAGEPVQADTLVELLNIEDKKELFPQLVANQGLEGKSLDMYVPLITLPDETEDYSFQQASEKVAQENVPVSKLLLAYARARDVIATEYQEFFRAEHEHFYL